jgi:ribosomal protein S18 acetylase RimI-like enzyme
MAPPPYTLRAATARDADFIYQLRADRLRAYVTAIWGWNETVQAARFAASFEPARYQVVVGAGRDVGAIAVEWQDDHVFLADIEIVPVWRGRGLGTALVGAVLPEACLRQLPVALQVLRGNPARWLYERLGFIVVAQSEGHYQMRTIQKNEQAIDASGNDDA